MLKNIKNYAMALGALAIAATSGTLMSFNTSNNEVKLAEEWHVFNPGTAAANPEDASQYEPGAPMKPSCEDGTTVCAVRTPDGQPLTNQYLQSLDLTSGIANENVIFYNP